MVWMCLARAGLANNHRGACTMFIQKNLALGVSEANTELQTVLPHATNHNNKKMTHFPIFILLSSGWVKK